MIASVKRVVLDSVSAEHWLSSGRYHQAGLDHAPRITGIGVFCGGQQIGTAENFSNAAEGSIVCTINTHTRYVKHDFLLGISKDGTLVIIGCQPSRKVLVA